MSEAFEPVGAEREPAGYQQVGVCLRHGSPTPNSIPKTSRSASCITKTLRKRRTCGVPTLTLVTGALLSSTQKRKPRNLLGFILVSYRC